MRPSSGAAAAAASVTAAASTASSSVNRKRRPRPAAAMAAARAVGSTLALLAVMLLPRRIESWTFVPPACTGPASKPLLPRSMPATALASLMGPAAAPDAFARRLLVRASATRTGKGLRGDVKRKGDKGSNSAGGSSSSSSRPRTRKPRNETSSSASAFGNGAPAAEEAVNGVETEAERQQRLQEEDDWLLQFSRDDPDAHTEVYSEPEERARKARETRERYDFTCLTVEEVARSYQVPISWLGDALCNFGVPPPIQWTARMGDLIDGERALELLEAMHGWDHAVMYDMYTWDSLRELAASHELDLGEVLQVCDEEKFALPFGLRSHLRVEQYARLMRRLGRAKELPDDVKQQFPDPDYPSV